MNYTESKMGNILIIDDEMGPRESIRIVLGKEYNCLTADGGVQGLDMLDEHPVDLVILDIKMPQMDGIETLRLIKKKQPDVMIVLLTGYGTLETAQKAIRIGAFDYIKKPFDISDLREVVKKGLEKKNLVESEKAHIDDLEQVIGRMRKEMSNFDRMSKLGCLSAGIVHEMKNPLTVILGYTQMILGTMKKDGQDGDLKLSGKSAHYLSVIEKETIHCADIAKKLLAVSRTSPEEPAQCDIREIVDDAEVLIQPQCSVNQIAIRKEQWNDVLYGNVVESNIHDILLNLCINAIQAIKQGGEIRLSSHLIKKSEKSLPDLTEEERTYLDNQEGREEFIAIGVSDSGGGIPEDLRSRVFEPFFTTKNEDSGTGLGLPVSKEKAEQNGGNLSLVRTGSDGTMFRLLLPVA